KPRDVRPWAFNNVQGIPMSTAPATTPPAGPAPVKEIRIISHSTLFYWWPVWAIGFLMAGLTFFSGQRMVSLDKHAEYHDKAYVTLGNTTHKDRAVWLYPDKASAKNPEKIRVSGVKNYGVLFAFVLLLVIAITNIPLRGLWSVIVIVFIISLSIIFA